MTLQRSSRLRWFLAGLAGLISATGFAPLGLWPLTILAITMLLWLAGQSDRPRHAAALGWWFGFGHFALGLNWIATAFTYQAAMPAWLGWIAVILLAAYLAAFPMIALAIAVVTAPRAPFRRIWVFSATWIATEWLRATLFTGFAWNPLSATLLDTPFAGLMIWTGTYGLSALPILAAGLILPMATALRARFGFGAVILVAGLVPLIPRSKPPQPPGALVRVVQPDIGQDQKWETGFGPRNFRRLAALTGRPGPEPRLILWPEAAVPDYLEEEPVARARLARLLGDRDILLTGGVALHYGRDGYADSAANSMFGLDARGRLFERYDKAHLVPYGEYLPMRPILSRLGLSRLAPGDIDFLPGPGPQSFAVPLFGKVGVQICYEIIFSGHVVDAADRPRFLFNPSNDAWFGAWGPPQHLAQARLRAIEEGLPVVRSTPTGISAVIDADGRLLAALPWRRAGAIDARIPPAYAPTAFARLGNLLPLLLALLLTAIARPWKRR